ncbi:hypothetical protein [Sphingorhabdus sp.]|uniref:hypothetical protein n=1 Tax=Sphingorhabdus sp. TaxID=1902408 RepID=UPI002FDB4485
MVSAKGRDQKPMLLTICFLLGIANFYMHKAVAESGHPYVEETKRYLHRHIGPYGSYALELALLIGALWLANTGALAVSLLYAAYTAINGVASWVLLSNKA